MHLNAYLEWNDRLASRFFRPEMSGRPVYLYVTNELILDLEKESTACQSDFITSLKTGPPWVTREGICQKALQTYQGWRRRGLNYPPYVGYLCLFVMAAGTSGDWAHNAYYPRLRKLLGENQGGMFPSFEKMWEIWEDLQQWSIQDKSGELGIFRARSVGSWIHIGYPTAQTILTEEERSFLPQIFARAALDPTSPPAETYLARIVYQFGASKMRGKTLDLLSRQRDKEAFFALLDVLEDELADWDGQVPEDGDAAGSRQPRMQGALRLCIRFDKVAAQVHATFRCRLNREFPGDELILTSSRQTTPFVCREYKAGWSSPLRFQDETDPADASAFDWVNGVNLHESGLGWQFKFPAGNIHLLINGAFEGLPGLVETHELPRHTPFYLLFHENAFRDLEIWAKLDCVNFQELTVLKGLPRGWKLASVAGVTSDERVKKTFPLLEFSHLVRLSFRNGLRSSRMNNFFTFAPPEIFVSGGDGTEEVYCDGKPLERPDTTSTYLLPADLPVDRRIVIEVKRGETLRMQSFHLTSDFPWRLTSPIEEFDRWGNHTADAIGKPRISGGLVAGFVPERLPFTRSPLLTKDLGAHLGRRVYFLGSIPGQVTIWPDEPFPSSWHPVWAIPEGKRSRAIYCGPDLLACEPTTYGDLPSKRDLKLWVELLWHKRKHIAQPLSPRLRKLWKGFQEVARNA